MLTWIELRSYYERLEQMRLVLSRGPDISSPARQHVEEQAALFERELDKAIDQLTVDRLKEDYRRMLWSKKAS